MSMVCCPVHSRPATGVYGADPASMLEEDSHACRVVGQDCIHQGAPPKLVRQVRAAEVSTHELGQAVSISSNSSSMQQGKGGHLSTMPLGK